MTFYRNLHRDIPLDIFQTTTKRKKLF